MYVCKTTVIHFNFSISHLYIIQQTGSENIQTWVTKVEFLLTTLNNVKQKSDENKKKLITYGIICWSNSKFSALTS